MDNPFPLSFLMNESTFIISLFLNMLTCYKYLQYNFTFCAHQFKYNSHVQTFRLSLPYLVGIIQETQAHGSHIFCFCVHSVFHAIILIDIYVYIYTGRKYFDHFANKHISLYTILTLIFDQ